MPQENTDSTKQKSGPLILAVETSGRRGSVALAQGPTLIAEVDFSGPMRHSAELFPSIKKLLDQIGRTPKQIEQVYISIGPGSFTGLRIACTLAKTMHLANQTKIVAVDTLDVIAANVTDFAEETKAEAIENVAAVLDAKRGQFFIAAYTHKNGERQKTLSDCLMTAEQFVAEFGRGAKRIWLMGEGLVYYRDKFKADRFQFVDEKYWYPRASKVHLLGWEMAKRGQFADALTLTPMYLRRCDAVPKKL